MKNRLTKYFYSTPNLVGMGLGTVGIGLTILGAVPIPALWPVVVGGLYGIGALGTPNRKDPQFTLDFEADHKEVKHELEKIVKESRKKIPSDMAAIVDRISQNIYFILDRSTNSMAGDQTLYSVKRTALSYLPETLNTYIAIPPLQAKVHPIKDGKTATQIVMEQLEMMDRAMEAVVTDVVSGDAQKLLTHSRFLAENFGEENQLEKR